MEPGLYYIGDLCYVFSNEDWDEVCGLIIDGNECLNGEFQFKDGRRFAMYNTKYGDGVYQDQFGNKFCVDSGSIGCVMVDDATKADLGEMMRLGTLVEMKEKFTTFGVTGLIKIGSTTIDTGLELEEDEEDYLEEDEEDYEV